MAGNVHCERSYLSFLPMEIKLRCCYLWNYSNLSMKTWHANGQHVDIDTTLLSCVSLIVRVNLLWVPHMYPSLISTTELGSSHRIPCNGTRAKWINSLANDQRYTCMYMQ